MSRPFSPADPALLYEQAPCGLFLARIDGEILSANSTFCAWLGRKETELRGQRFQSLLTMGAQMFHQTHWHPLLLLQGSVSEVKLDFKHQDGRHLPMLLNARVLTLPDATKVCSVAAFMATDRHSYEQELVKARSDAMELLDQRTRLQAEASDRGLFAEQMIGIVSHDLRNPLTAIRMGAEMLVLDEQDPRRLKLASRINESVDRALSLIADLLDFTLTRTGRPLTITRHAINLEVTVAEALEELRYAFPGTTLVHHHLGPTDIEADGARLAQALGNIVANAARYGDATKPITVSTAVIDGKARMEVHNWGEPIASGVLPTLFQAMTRGAIVHDAGGGVGLGLYIVSEIAKGHGGQTLARSSTDAGTWIGFEFPDNNP